MKNLLFALLSLLMFSCSVFTGEEVGRLAINQLSTETEMISKEADVKLEAGDEIVIWSEMDMEYEGELELNFRVSIEKDGESYSYLEIDPTSKDLTIGESKTVLNDKTSWSFSGQNIIFNVKEDGLYSFKGILVSSGNNTVVIKKAELVLKRL